MTPAPARAGEPVHSKPAHPGRVGQKRYPQSIALDDVRQTGLLQISATTDRTDAGARKSFPGVKHPHRLCVQHAVVRNRNHIEPRPSQSVGVAHRAHGRRLLHLGPVRDRHLQVYERDVSALDQLPRALERVAPFLLLCSEFKIMLDGEVMSLGVCDVELHRPDSIADRVQVFPEPQVGNLKASGIVYVRDGRLVRQPGPLSVTASK